MNTIYMQFKGKKLSPEMERRLVQSLAISITLNTWNIDLISINGNPHSLKELRKEFSRHGYMSLKEKME